MTLLKSLSERQSQNLNNALPWVVAALAFLGFLDASYLAIEHYLGATPYCSLIKGCEVVLTSKYSVVFGIPVALFGAIYYFAIFMSALLAVSNNSKNLWKLIIALSSLGLIAYLYFIYIQLFVLNAICIYCIFSAAMTLLIFFSTLANWYTIEHKPQLN